MTVRDERVDPHRMLSEISRALRHLPGATALHVFGSLADNLGDGYSDIDLTVGSSEPEVTIAARHATLNRVAPIVLEWVIEPSQDAWAATYLFAGASPFQKLDLGIRTPRDSVDGRLLWRQDVELSMELAHAAPSTLFAPPHGTIEHFVVGHLLGATRYVKARRRGNDLVCWRFASALVNAVLALHYSRACHMPFLGRALTTLEYLDLDHALPVADRDRLLSVLHLASAADMNRSVRLLLADMVQTSADLGASIPEALLALFNAFFDAELGPVG